MEPKPWKKSSDARVGPPETEPSPTLKRLIEEGRKKASPPLVGSVKSLEEICREKGWVT